MKKFSLLPREKTKITVKTFKKTLVDNKQASGILDSHTQESADDFEETLSKEQEEMARTVANSVEKHAQKASAKREVHIIRAMNVKKKRVRKLVLSERLKISM